MLVACKLFALGETGQYWTYASVAAAVEISTSEVHDALKRCRSAQLVVPMRETEIVSKKHFYDLLVFAVPRIFYAVRGGLDLGWPTGVQLPTLLPSFEGLRPEPLKDALPLVWPDPKGTTRGETLLPIYPSVPEAARKDAGLYELLALIDVVRLGDLKHKKKAMELLAKRIFGKAID